VSLNLSEMGPVGRSLGVLATLMGEFELAQQHFDEALKLSHDIGAPPHVARVSVDYARMLLERRADDDVPRAQTLLADATLLARELGMAGLLVDNDELERQLKPR
jgi:hypothetical protein